MKPTRKSLGDRDGNKTMYVVEAHYNDGTIWAPCHNTPNSLLNFTAAVKLKDAIYFHYKTCGPGVWTRKHFRIALYVRAEDESDGS